MWMNKCKITLIDWLSLSFLCASPHCGTTPAPSWLWPWMPSRCLTGWGTTASPCGRWRTRWPCLGERWLTAAGLAPPVCFDMFLKRRVWAYGEFKLYSRWWLLMVPSPFPWCTAAVSLTPWVPAQMRCHGNLYQLAPKLATVDVTASGRHSKALRARD